MTSPSAIRDPSREPSHDAFYRICVTRHGETGNEMGNGRRHGGIPFAEHPISGYLQTFNRSFGFAKATEMDLASIAAGMAAAKTGFETLRIAIALVRDAQGLLPAGEKKEAFTRTLQEADAQVRLGEAQIAQALGYELCRCAFPPTPMLTVGWHHRPDGVKPLPVHECPQCGSNDARQIPWTRRSPMSQELMHLQDGGAGT